MTDIIVISPLTFLKHRKKDVQASILKKYQDIFEMHSCFKYESNIFYPKGVIKKQVAVLPIKKPKEPLKVFVGIMNVINTTNYVKMLNKIKMLVSSTNVSMIIKTILKICSEDVFYIQIHIKLIEDILKYVKDDAHIVYTTLQEFIDVYQQDKEWMTLSPDNEKKGYLEFCDKQKWKASIISKNLIILELVKHFKINMDIRKYVELLEEDLLNLLNEEDYDGATVVINMMIDIAKMNSVYVKNINISNLYAMVSSKKIIFILENLARYVYQNKDAYDRIFSKPSIKVVEGMYGSLKDVISC